MSVGSRTRRRHSCCCPIKRPCVKHSYGGSVLTQMTPESTINRVVSNRQLTPSQETVGQRLLLHAKFPRFLGTKGKRPV